MVKTGQEIKNIIHRYVLNLQEQGAMIDKVVLYGSYVNKKAGVHSDIDIAVISAYFRDLGIRERQEFLGTAFGDIYEPIEPLGFAPEEYEKAEPGTILNEIKRTGKILYEK